MRIDAIAARALEIPFKVSFRHASAERRAMQSLWVEARAGDLVGVGEGCPREYVTHEDLPGAIGFVEAHRAQWLRTIVDVPSLEAHVRSSQPDIDRHPAAWSAVEIALLDLLGKSEGKTVERLLGAPAAEGVFQYTAVIGDEDAAGFEGKLGTYLRYGFRDFKIKLSGDLERDRGKVRLLAAAGIGAERVRADANNLFPEAARAIEHLAALEYPFFAIEEPLHAGDYAGMRSIAAACRARIILDESLLRVGQLDGLRDDAPTWIANVRVSKMGGLMRAMDVVRAAGDSGMKIVVGAHVGETSVLTRAGLAVASLARELGILVGLEGAFGTFLLERDIVDPPIMFGARGELDAGGGFPAHGLGLQLASPASAR